jgi:hypothetical protein
MAQGLILGKVVDNRERKTVRSWVNGWCGIGAVKDYTLADSKRTRKMGTA